MTPDILIVGAGLSGLACGKRLAECGVPFQILEAADQVGGRYRTDVVEGFRLDHTCPLFFTAFPEARRVLDLDALELKPFSRALLVRFGGKFHRVSDPRFEPFSAARSLANPIGTLRDKLRMIRFFEELHRGKMEQEHDERLALDLLRWNGRFSPAMIDRFFRPLAGMLFHDRELATSSRLFRFVFRILSEGPPAIPSRGVQAIPNQLIQGDDVRFGAKVIRLGHREVVLEDGEVMRARAVVVATDGPTAARLLGEPEPARRNGATLFYSAEQAPIAEPILMFDGEGRGPVNHLAVLSNLSSEYAPEGKSLIAVGVVGDAGSDDAELDRLVRVQLTEWFGSGVSLWKLLRVSHDSFPDQTAGTLDPWQRPVRLRPGLYACGSHRDNATIDGRLQSGFRAAQAVMEDLHATRT